MSQLRLAAPGPDRLRAVLRQTDGVLGGCPIGTVPILWNNVDVPALRDESSGTLILDEIARLGYDGCQFGLGFPTGHDLRTELAARGLRLAEVYAAIPCGVDGPGPNALEATRERLAILSAAGGDVLCLALDGSPERSIVAGRAGPGTPTLSDAGWGRLGDLVAVVAEEGIAAGHRVAFHPHAGTFIETADEIARLVATTDTETVGICVDVGHALVGGSDPVALIRSLGRRVTHVHLKDVDGRTLELLRADASADFGDAVEARLFTELGAGELDLIGVIDALVDIGYTGWLMVEQDSSWGPPSEAAAIGRRVLASVLGTYRRGGTSDRTT